jgi:hypothetical protein
MACRFHVVPMVELVAACVSVDEKRTLLVHKICQILPF